MRLSPRTWGKLTLGVLVIGGILVALWASNDPSLPKPTPVERTPVAPQLHDAHATVIVQGARSNREARAAITCDGPRREASGFWKDDPRAACDALASTRGALLASLGCPATLRARTRLQARGRFGSRRFDHKAQRGGCPDDSGWLAVNVLASPVLTPDQELDKAAAG
jgi:hypothetical protein